MKQLIPVALLFVLATSFTVTSIYDLAFTTMDQEDHAISDYQGKEILFVLLPVSRNVDDSAFLQSLDSLSINHQDSVTIIGVPSYEEGYIDESMDTLLQWYQSLLSDHILLSVAMYTHKASADLQHPLFAWLTKKEQNEHFDLDITGSRQCFFVNAEGVLHSIIMPGERLDEETVHRILYD